MARCLKSQRWGGGNQSSQSVSFRFSEKQLSQKVKSYRRHPVLTFGHYRFTHPNICNTQAQHRHTGERERKGEREGEGGMMNPVLTSIQAQRVLQSVAEARAAGELC